MAENLSYLCVNFDELSERTGWDTLAERGLLFNFLVKNELVDDFLNYAEQVAEEESSS